MNQIKRAGGGSGSSGGGGGGSSMAVVGAASVMGATAMVAVGGLVVVAAAAWWWSRSSAMSSSEFEVAVSHRAAARHAYHDDLEAVIQACKVGCVKAKANSNFEEAEKFSKMHECARAILAAFARPTSKVNLQAGLDQMRQVWQLEQTGLENQIQAAKESAARQELQVRCSAVKSDKRVSDGSYCKPL
jgi:hypothetical protein